MKLNISNHGYSVIERGVYYYSPIDYPHITSREMKSLLDFIAYEKTHGRKTEIICENESVLFAISNALAHPETIGNITLPDKIENIACACKQNGCMTDFICHSTDIKAAQQILSGGRLLSAVNVYGKTGDELSIEKSDSLWNDPADYFEYIMFNWGNCIYGEYVIMSVHYDDPCEEYFEISKNPGVRFYFKYDDILRHPGHTFDGYHIVKVKDEIILSDYLHACIVPEQYKEELTSYVSPELVSKVHYLPHTGLTLREWSNKIYEFIREK
jgi:hypothetical protein